MRILLLSFTAMLAACSAGTDKRECTSGSDCPSGACEISGKCVPKASTDAGAVDTAVVVPDAPAETAVDASPSETSIGCTPNDDGTIAATEVPIRAGLKATFKIAKDAPFNTAGVAVDATHRKWDLSVALPGDTAVLVETEAVEGKWFGAKFAGATYATLLTSSSDLLGVFDNGATGLLLRGVASKTDGAMRTELTYATPITVLAFPLKLGASYKTTSNVTGMASGVFANYTETYESKVDAQGEVITPFGSFKALRVSTVLTRTVGVVPTVTRTFAFVAECFGTIATITSKPNEMAAEPTTAAEVRRLAP